jgi:hypothetical protein
MSEQFYIHGRGSESCVNWSNGGVEAFYEILISLARRSPAAECAPQVIEFLSELLETGFPGGRAFEVDLAGPSARPVEFWRCVAGLIAKLADEELGREQPAEDLVGPINWEDEARCSWRKFLEKLYALIDEALPPQSKLSPLRPWQYKPHPKPDPNNFLCQGCGKAYIKPNDDKCPACGWTWIRPEQF